jgi:hypothetical protein
VHLKQKDVSSEHASLRWSGQHWEVRDLGSRNGTFREGVRLQAGKPVKLTLGQTVRFGGQSEWRLSGDEPPQIVAMNLMREASVATSTGYLCLPDDNSHELVIFRHGSGRWIAEDSAHQRFIQHGNVIVCRGESWRIFVPDGAIETLEAESSSAGPIELLFRVSRDEEHVELTVRVGETQVLLANRAHHYALLTLARLKQKDENDGSSDTDSGWVHIDDLARMLGNDETYVNLCVHRFRRQIADSGIPAAIPLIERRQGSGRLRLGAVQFEIGRL